MTEELLALLETLLAAWQETHDLDFIYNDETGQKWTVEEAEDLIEYLR